MLIDIEWTRDPEEKKHTTQLAACRVDDSWNVVDEFSALICPADLRSCDWKHIAYNGYSANEFRAGEDEGEAMLRFFRWLRPEDIICCWQHESRDLLRELYLAGHTDKLPQRCVCANRRAYAIAESNGVFEHTLYALARAYGIDTPAPEHCSANDLETLRRLLAAMELTEQALTDATAKKTLPKPPRREHNKALIEGMPYQYLYTPTSGIFHSRDCKVILGAAEICGCMYYKTAMKRRRPCKLCHPQNDGTYREAPPPRPEKKKPNKGINKQVTAQLLGNVQKKVAYKDIVGRCNYSLHPGELTKALMDRHDCIGKECSYFEKYSDRPYWQKQWQLKMRKHLPKGEKKAIQKQRKTARAQVLGQTEELLGMKELYQSYADEAGYAMRIIRVEKVRSGTYRVFFVSENPYADGTEYPLLLEAAQRRRPRPHILLRHIRDVDGHFVTTSEYEQRRRPR